MKRLMLFILLVLIPIFVSAQETRLQKMFREMKAEYQKDEQRQTEISKLVLSYRNTMLQSVMGLPRPIQDSVMQFHSDVVIAARSLEKFYGVSILDWRRFPMKIDANMSLDKLTRQFLQQNCLRLTMPFLAQPMLEYFTEKILWIMKQKGTKAQALSVKAVAHIDESQPILLLKLFSGNFTSELYAGLNQTDSTFAASELSFIQTMRIRENQIKLAEADIDSMINILRDKKREIPIRDQVIIFKDASKRAKSIEVWFTKNRSTLELRNAFPGWKKNKNVHKPSPLPPDITLVFRIGLEIMQSDFPDLFPSIPESWSAADEIVQKSYTETNTFIETIFDSSTYWAAIQPLKTFEDDPKFYQTAQVLKGFSNYIKIVTELHYLPEDISQPLIAELDNVDSWSSNIFIMKNTLSGYEGDYKQTDNAFYDLFSLMPLLEHEKVLRIYYQASMATQALNYRNSYPEQWINYRIFQTYFYDVFYKSLPKIYKTLSDNEKLLLKTWQQVHPFLKNPHTPPSIRAFWIIMEREY